MALQNRRYLEIAPSSLFRIGSEVLLKREDMLLFLVSKLGKRPTI